MRRLSAIAILIVAAACSTPAVVAQAPPTPPGVIAQQEAMAELSMLDGEWRGTGRILIGNGSWYEFVQTERIGLLAAGTVRLIEGTGFGPTGEPSFRAFAVLSFDPKVEGYLWRS